MAKCPKCDASLKSLNIEPLTFKVGGTSAVYGGALFAYCCPSCDTVLGAEMDSVAFKSDLVREFLNKRKKTK